MSIQIECLSADKYDPVYNIIVKEYKQFLGNGDAEAEKKVLDRVKRDLELAIELAKD